ncbi:MAG: acyl-CoA dehydrogenase family protein [Thermoleophilia bacterium]
MDFDLSDEHRLIRATVREFAEQEIAPKAEDLDRTASFPYEIVAGLADLGLMGIPFPEEYGGAGGDTLAYALTIEELARVDSSVAITVAAHTSLGTNPIWLFGTEAQKREWIPRLASGRELGAFGLTEPESGSDAGALRTRARLEPGAAVGAGEWVLNGTKAFITNSGTDITALVTAAAVSGDATPPPAAAPGDGRPGIAATDEGGVRPEISNFLVPQGTPGYSRAPSYRKMGWRASDTHELHFDDARIPEANLLGERGRGLAQFLTVLDAGRVGVAAIGLGLAQGVYEMALRYARERRQFGRPIGSFQAVAFMLADLATEIEAARLLLYKAAVAKDRGRPFELLASMAKLTTSRLAVRAADQALQIHGGYGYMDEYPVSRFYRDAKVLEIGEGTSEIQRMVIARMLGAGGEAEPAGSAAGGAAQAAGRQPEGVT